MRADKSRIWVNVTPRWWQNATGPEIGDAVLAVRREQPAAEVRVSAEKLYVSLAADLATLAYLQQREHVRRVVAGVRAS